MRKSVLFVVALTGVALLSGCGRSSGGGGGVFGRQRLDEFAVARQQPLVVPPDFALTPPTPGAPRPQEADASTQALQAMFGGPARVSQGEQAVTTAAGQRAEPGIRSAAGDPATNVVDKGGTTREIIAAPSGSGQDASVSTPK